MKLTQARQKRFLEALSETGSVTLAVAVAGTSRTRVYELRKTDPGFASASLHELLAFCVANKAIPES